MNGRAVLPINGLCVTDPTFPNGTAGGAVDDGLRGYFTTTWTTGQSTVTILSATTSVTVTNTGRWNGQTVALVTFPGFVTSAGIDFGPSWVGKPIAIAGAGTAGGVLVAKVVDFHYDLASSPYYDRTSSAYFAGTLTLNIAAPTPLAASPQSIACPCFTSGSDGSGIPTCVGKLIWLSNAGSTEAGTGNPQLNTPCRDTIASVVTPFQCTINGTIPGPSRAALPGSLLVWGTNNTEAVINAGLASVAIGRKTIFFPGWQAPTSTGLFVLFDFVTNFQSVPTLADYDASVALSALHWEAADADALPLSACGSNGNQTYGIMQDTRIKKGVVPWNAPPIPPLRSTVQGAHLSRCATLESIVVCVTGDSWGTSNPSGTGGNDHCTLLAAELARQNPGKTIHMVNRAISGSTWQMLAGIPTGFPSQGWYTDHTKTWLSYIETVPVDGLGNVTPDLVVIYGDGNNDAGNNCQMYRNDIVDVINTIKGWPTTNGLPPDIITTIGVTKTTEMFTTGAREYYCLQSEYCTTFLRSFARTQGIGFIDFGTSTGYRVEGWAPDVNILRQVPALASGTAAATAGYSCEYLCRDFYFAFELGTSGQTGSSFWAAAGNLSLTLSCKGDNRLWFGIDGSNNLNVCAVSWGLPVTTTCSITAGRNVLTTIGQTTLTPTSVVNLCAPSSYRLSNNADSFTFDMVGECVVYPGIGYAGADYRTFIMGVTNGANAFGCDGQGNVATANTIYVGGMMFVANDAKGQANCIAGGAGSTTHMLTGTNSLVTTVSGVSSNFQATLADNASNTLSRQAETVFLGAITYGPGYDTAMSAGNDAGANPILTVQKRGTHVRIGYVMGGHIWNGNFRAILQGYEIVIWEGDVECWGGPFIPQLFASGGSVSVQCVMAWLDVRDQRKPQLTERECWGVNNTIYDWPEGGDTSHYSQRAITQIVGETLGQQNWYTPTNYANNFGVVTATTAGYTIPANQAFTRFNQGSVLPTCPTTLPSTFPQGGRLEIFTASAITSWTISAQSNFTIDGAAVSAGTAGQTIAYRLNGTVWTRVQ